VSDAQKAACVEAAKEMLMILQEPETNDFDGIATGDESWFQHTTASSKMFTRSARINYDHGVLHRKETYRVGDSSNR
jgi:hypothetical protein